MKRLLFSLLYWTGLTRLQTWRTRQQVKILCFHSITLGPNPETDQYKLHLPADCFRSQLKHLVQIYKVISLGEYIRIQRAGAPLPDNAVILTFDDGFRNFQTVAAPILVEYNLTATVFIITAKTAAGVSGQTRQQWQPDDDKEHLTWAQAKSLANSEQFEIGSHTHTHQRLTQLTSAEARQEMMVSLTAITAEIGESRLPLSYPHGEMSANIRMIAEELGHSCALSSELGGNGADADLFALRRIVIASDDNLPTFAARVAGVTWGLHRLSTRLFGAARIPSPVDACPE